MVDNEKSSPSISSLRNCVDTNYFLALWSTMKSCPHPLQAIVAQIGIDVHYFRELLWTKSGHPHPLLITIVQIAMDADNLLVL